MLTQERLKQLLTYFPETGLFIWNIPVKGTRGKGKEAGTRTKKGYVDVCIEGKKYGLHRLAFLYMLNTLPLCVDHKNTLKWDNRWENLRPATYETNGYNYGGRETHSGVRNVYYDPRGKSKYFVFLKVGGKKHHYGFFQTIEEAALVANNARRELHGEFFWNNVEKQQK